ncbi:DNA mismatch repair endonuclease MutH [Alteromonas sediminis]|uniref:DNA mismatch repair protein MutH n=1 Tax=Alteromonas sediminis TaxID=2259342 RepID=A0A3N5Z9N7_9ALTE|nr:DNA mismatch repair endonuclease MutH [Alteromonas sediminis]RPJ66038.1 DNA mismatch repair endonuclease MutH [Alteromonas sediminis]
MQPPVTPPDDLSDLLSRARSIAGWSFGELAIMAGIEIPKHFKRHKGWTGQLIELWLGATAGSKPQQDFPELGVELKTIPIDAAGNPLETTYVCYTPLLPVPGSSWQRSNVRNKLSCVLWVPVEGERTLAVEHRRVGSAVLWSPTEEELSLLEQDWNELNDLIIAGQIERITSRHGQVLQLRPKAANGRVLTDAIGEEGQRIKTRPRGYYLRKTFTQAILHRAFYQQE